MQYCSWDPTPVFEHADFNLIASPMDYYEEVITEEISASMDNLRQTVKCTPNSLGKGRKRKVTDRQLYWMGLSSTGSDQND